MQKLPEISYQPPTNSLTESAPSTNARQEYAAQRARLLFGCYRKGDANDPETYTAAIAAVLAEYEEAVIARVTDPRTGIPRKLKFLPNPAELSDFCDEAKAAIAAEEYAVAKGYQWNGRFWESPNGQNQAQN